MALYPRATKTSLAKLLRAKGFCVPSIRRTEFTHYHRAFWLNWDDGTEWHKATYSAAGGRPYLYVDNMYIKITLAEVIPFDLVEEK